MAIQFQIVVSGIKHGPIQNIQAREATIIQQNNILKNSILGSRNCIMFLYFQRLKSRFFWSTRPKGEFGVKFFCSKKSHCETEAPTQKFCLQFLKLINPFVQSFSYNLLKIYTLQNFQKRRLMRRFYSQNYDVKPQTFDNSS